MSSYQPGALPESVHNRTAKAVGSGHDSWWRCPPPKKGAFRIRTGPSASKTCVKERGVHSDCLLCNAQVHGSVIDPTAQHSHVHSICHRLLPNPRVSPAGVPSVGDVRVVRPQLGSIRMAHLKLPSCLTDSCCIITSHKRATAPACSVWCIRGTCPGALPCTS